jgi:hypothetical protein
MRCIWVAYITVVGAIRNVYKNSFGQSVQQETYGRRYHIMITNTTDIHPSQPLHFAFEEAPLRKYKITLYTRPYLRTGQRGPGPGRQISRGGIFKKKMEIEVWYARKKRLSTREKFKGDLY